MLSVKRLVSRLYVLPTAVLLLPSAATLLSGSEPPLVYPRVEKSDQVDDFHGTKVADPFRGLENIDAASTQSWIDAENTLTFGYLQNIPARPMITARLTKLWDYEKFGIPYKEGGRYFYTRNTGLQNQSVLYTLKSLDDKPRVLIDPNTFSDDGTVALSGTSVSHNGKYIAYGKSDGGSDWQEWAVRNIETGKDLPDRIQWVKFSGMSWTKDGQGFFYSRYDKPDEETKLKQANYYQKLYYHKLNTPQSQDDLIYQRPDHKDWGFGGSVTDDGRYLIIHVWKGTLRKNLIFYKDLTDPQAKVVELITEFESQYSFLDNDGSVFWFRTDRNAPNSRVVAIDTNKPEYKNWVELIPESRNALRGVNVVNNMFVASYLEDAHTRVRVFDIKGKHVRDVPFPEYGTAGGFGGKRSFKETFYSFTSYTRPAMIYRYDLATGKSSVFRKPKVDYNKDVLETKQIFYKSKDGTTIPMYITHLRGLKLDGNNPTYLYGYGGFDIPITPIFRVSNLVWMEMGGVLAVANIRGGGEYGKAWHEAGMKLNKQNCFDDFIAAAQWLIDKKYTSTPRLAIGGRSNGGLLVGACMTQRPDLFGAVLPGVGVLDMLRFEQFTIGWAWASDYGTVKNKEDFKALYAYSPLHNVKPGTAYPATMIATADRDDRVFPAHSFKFAAALQEAQSGSAPILIRIETRAGHGAGKPTSKRIEEVADHWSFLSRVLKMDLSSFQKSDQKSPAS